MTNEIANAVAAALHREAPYRDEELTSLRGPLLVSGAQSLHGLERCAGLEELTLFACTLPAIDEVARLPKLRSLALIACDVADVSGLASCRALENLEINFCLCEGLEPSLPQMTSLRRLTSFGVSWSANDRDVAVDALVRTVSNRGGRLLVAVDDRDSWRIGRRLRDCGLPLCYSGGPLGVLLVRPGARDDRPGVEFVSTWPNLVEQALADEAATADAAAFMAHAAIPMEQPESGPARFVAQWQVGDASDARAWIASADSSAEERMLLAEFVARFAGAELVRETQKGHERIERDQNVRLPTWLKKIRAEAVASVGAAYRRLEMRFDDYDHDPFSLRDRERWFAVGFFGYSDSGLRELVGHRCGLYPIGFEIGGGWRLAIANDDSDDRRIFLYDERMLHSAGDAARVESRRYALFDSYAKMLSRVAAVRVAGREIAAVR